MVTMDLAGEINKLRKESGSTLKEAEQKLKQLQKNIRAGKWDGDEISAFLILYYDDLSGEKRKLIEDLGKELAKNTDKQILVVKEEESIIGCPGVFAPAYINPMFIGIDRVLFLGILNNNKMKLDLKQGNIFLPTEKHGYFHMLRDREWKLQQGDIPIHYDELIYLNKQLPDRMHPVPNDGKWHKAALNIFYGEEIGFYFRTPFFQYLPKELYRGKGKKAEQTRKSLREQKCYNEIYTKALMLLGIELQDNKEEYRKEQSNKHETIVLEIYKLVNEQTRLEEKISKVYDSIKRGGFIENGAVTMVENNDDALVATLGQRNRIEEVIGEIKVWLNKAIELGIHKSKETYELVPGAEVRFSGYISNICGKYNITIPE